MTKTVNPAEHEVMLARHENMFARIIDQLAALDKKQARADAVVEAAREFVAKVERGEARSKESYAAFKKALAQYDGET